MPLRDHFHKPLSERRSWDRVFGGWPAMIVLDLYRRLPPGFNAQPQVHLGTSIEVDVATFEEIEPQSDFLGGGYGGTDGGVATATWAPPEPTLTIATGPPDPDEYEVLVYDGRRDRRLVAAIEIVSPSNKDRPEHRRAFVAKCSAMIRERVCVAIVDIVTDRSADLYGDLMEHLGHPVTTSGGDSSLSAVAIRWNKPGKDWRLENWAYPLAVGQTLPTLPLWLAKDYAIPLDLEASYQETCRVLRIP